MKKIQRLSVGQLDEMETLSMREQRHIVGGSGCVWDCLAYVLDCYDGKRTSNKEFYNYMETFKNEWQTYQRSKGGQILPSGDPAANQSGDLYDFINQYFNTTTGNEWGTSDWNGMISASGSMNQGSGCSYSGMAFVIVGDGNNQHALVIEGEKLFDSNEGKYYYNCYDPDGEITRVWADQIRYGTGVSVKN